VLDRKHSYVFLNDGRSGFNDSVIAKISSESATRVVLAYFDGDGFDDLAVPHRDGGQSRIFFNDGKGKLENSKPFGPAKTSAQVAAVGDLNGDGFVDLVRTFTLSDRPFQSPLTSCDEAYKAGLVRLSSVHLDRLRKRRRPLGLSAY